MARFMKHLLRILSCSLAGMVATECHAQVHPPEPAVNLGDTSFLDGIAGPGLLVEEIVDASHNTQVFNGGGDPIAGAAASYGVSGVTHIAWLSSRSLFGGWYGVEVLQAGAYVHAGPDKNVAGAGDLTISPLIFQWKERKLRSLKLIQRAVLDLDLPTGEYRSAEALSLSSHAFDVHPYYAVTLLPSKHLETSWRVHYLWNGTNNNPGASSGARSTQAGQAIHFNATAGYRVARRLWAGANGYYLKQVTSPLINGQSLRDSPEQVGAVGPGMLWDLGKCMVYANAYHEVGAINRPQGNKIVLRLQWIPGKGDPEGHS